MAHKLFLPLLLRPIFAGLILASVFMTGCATRVIAPVSSIENSVGAINVPYRLSSSGRILLDVSVNGTAARPFALDTGASVSVLYGKFAQSVNLKVSDRTLFVRGIIGQGARPVIENVGLQMGPQVFQMEQMVMLETPLVKDEAVGLIGGDVLGMFVALFNAETLMATFVPRPALHTDAFAGWNEIPLQIFKEANASSRLYFANMDVDGRDVPVLIDTGSNLNFINWKLATLDEDIKRLERKLMQNGTLQGALDTTSASTTTTFSDLKMGQQNWDDVQVVVMSLGALESVAPVNEPMMVAGAGVFTPHTLAFDLAGLKLYVRPDTKP